MGNANTEEPPVEKAQVLLKDQAWFSGATAVVGLVAALAGLILTLNTLAGLPKSGRKNDIDFDIATRGSKEKKVRLHFSYLSMTPDLLGNVTNLRKKLKTALPGTEAFLITESFLTNPNVRFTTHEDRPRYGYLDRVTCLCVGLEDGSPRPSTVKLSLGEFKIRQPVAVEEMLGKNPDISALLTKASQDSKSMSIDCDWPQNAAVLLVPLFYSRHAKLGDAQWNQWSILGPIAYFPKTASTIDHLKEASSVEPVRGFSQPSRLDQFLYGRG